MAKKNSLHRKEVLKIKLDKIRLEHQKHDLGCGAHDSRPRRQRTRGSQTSQAIQEYYEELV